MQSICDIRVLHKIFPHSILLDNEEERSSIEKNRNVLYIESYRMGHVAELCSQNKLRRVSTRQVLRLIFQVRRRTHF